MKQRQQLQKTEPRFTKDALIEIKKKQKRRQHNKNKNKIILKEGKRSQLQQSTFENEVAKQEDTFATLLKRIDDMVAENKHYLQKYRENQNKLS